MASENIQFLSQYKTRVSYYYPSMYSGNGSMLNVYYTNKAI